MTEPRAEKAFDYENVWQGGWNDATTYGPACRHRRRIVAQLVASVPHESVLDLGCGDGALVEYLSSQLPGVRLMGSDLSGEAIRIAQRRIPGARFIQQDLSGVLSFEPVDVVVLSEVLEHIPDDERVLKAVASKARHVVISVPGGAADKVDKRFGHVRNYPGRLLAEKMRRCGYEVAAFHRWGFPFYDVQQWLSWSGEPKPGSPPPPSEGAYGPAKKSVAAAIYALYYFNLLPLGTQVFAIGRSLEISHSHLGRSSARRTG